MSSRLNFFKDKHGRITIAQPPNTLLQIAIILWILALLPISEMQFFSKWAVIPVMLYWSYLEIFFGNSAFRRLLGIIVAIIFIINLFQLLKLV